MVLPYKNRKLVLLTGLESSTIIIKYSLYSLKKMLKNRKSIRLKANKTSKRCKKIGKCFQIRHFTFAEKNEDDGNELLFPLSILEVNLHFAP